MKPVFPLGLLIIVVVSACGESSATRPDPVPPAPPPLTIAQLSIEPQSVESGRFAQGTLILSGPAPAGGAVVTLASNHEAAASTNRPTTVPAGTTSHAFLIGTSGVIDTAVDVTITATLGTSTRSAILQVMPFLPGIIRFWVQTPILGSLSGSAYVELDRPARAPGANVAISVNDTVARPPASVLIQAGATRGDFTFATSRPSQDVRVTFTATYGSSSENTTIRVVRGSP